jgi:hypothetical protein
MPMDSVTQENVANILKEKADAEQELAQLRATTCEQMWLRELDVLDREYDVYKRKREQIQSGGMVEVKTATKPKAKALKIKA